MERFYDPVSGSIEFEGIDIKALNVHSLREHIGYVGQGMMFCCFDLHFISAVVHSSLFSNYFYYFKNLFYSTTLLQTILRTDIQLLIDMTWRKLRALPTHTISLPLCLMVMTL
jgi:hypothetical protein